jgi:phytoene dehydrogenase-like protein
VEKKMKPYLVVGGGLAGLVAANALADKGRHVTLMEQSQQLGGRAMTQLDHGYQFNLGSHAIYRGSCAVRLLRQWKVPFQGHVPNLGSAAYFVYEGRRFPFFRGLKALLQSRLLGVREKLDTAWVLIAFTSDGARVGETMEQWISRHTSSERARLIACAITRLSTYSNDLAALDARMALSQIRLGIANGVLYLDGGWQTLVDGLGRRALSLGVEIQGGQRVESLASLDAAGVVLAVPPAAVERITGVSMPPLRPTRAACLDIGLPGLPEGAASFMLGVDQPLYFSVHSKTARLAPEGAAVVHLAKYLTPGEEDAAADRAELEQFADLGIPGWRDRADVVRFLPNLTVTHGLPSPKGRPGVSALNLDDVAIAGDWVGGEEMLAGAAVASALQASGAILQLAVQAA